MSYTISHAFPGIGLTLSIGNSSSPITYTTIGEVKGVAGPDLKVETADVTNVQSPGGVKEFKPTLTDPGELDFTCNYIPDDAGQIALQTAALETTKPVLPFQLSLPQSSLQGSEVTPGVWNFNGIVNGLKYDTPLDKEATVAVKIKVSGLPSFTAAH